MPVALFTLVTDERRCSRARSAWATCARRRCRTRSAATSSSPARRWRSSTRASHPKVHDNPSIEEYGIVAYLGVPLTTSDGVRLGALCAIDHEPRQWTGRDHGVLEDLAGAAMAEVELRRANRAVAAAAAELHFAATHDTLTRLGNRRALLDDLGQLLAERRAGDVRAASTCTGMRGFNDAHGHMAGDELLARLGERLESRAGRPRARLPARRRAAVRAAAAPARATPWPSPARALDERECGRRLPRGDRRAAARGERASPRSCASRTPGWHATGMLRPLALDLEERRAAARLGGGEEKIARQHAAGQADRARADRAAVDGDFTELGIHAAPALLPAGDGRPRGAGRRRDHRLGVRRRPPGRRRRLRLHGHGRLDGHDRRDQGRAAARARADQADPDRVAARLRGRAHPGGGRLAVRRHGRAVPRGGRS